MPTRPPLALSFAALISNFDRFAVTPMLLLIALALDEPLAAAVAVASGYFLAYGLSQPLWGLLSDRFGRLPVMRGTMLAAAAGGVVSALAPNLTALVVARVVTGPGSSRPRSATGLREGRFKRAPALDRPGGYRERGGILRVHPWGSGGRRHRTNRSGGPEDGTSDLVIKKRSSGAGPLVPDRADDAGDVVRGQLL
ncbi:MFS transporter [Saccharopolyspora elongata]|uniref:MFS transporter n=1 Tax=Saccharopolyspora elongata TaxID=2530387 RepID=UPI001F40C330|nr:MFS transporter [Saccharopolyspora elongata]